MRSTPVRREMVDRCKCSVFVTAMAIGAAWAATALPANAAQKQMYGDWAHRFSMAIPGGCSAAGGGGSDSARFRCGVTWPGGPLTYSYATVMFGARGTGTPDLQHLVDRLLAGWSDLKLLENNKHAKLQGRPARMMFASGTDSSGLKSKVEIVAAVNRDRWYALSFAAPELQWGHDSQTYFAPMIAGFRVGS